MHVGVLASFVYLWPLLAQAGQLPPGAVDISSGWRVHAGDDLAWAQPDFDDQSWSVEDTGATLSAGWRWYRKRISVPVQGQPLVLLIIAPGNDYEVYANGLRLPGAAILAHAHGYGTVENTLPLAGMTGDLELAIRLRSPRVDTEFYGLTFDRVAIGGPAAIETERTLAHRERLLRLVPCIAFNSALTLGGLGALLLFLPRRDKLEYLWLGLFLVCGGVTALTSYFAWYGFVPLVLNDYFGDLLFYPVIAFQIEFTYAFARHRVGRVMRVYEVFAVASILAVPLIHSGLIGAASYLIFEAALNVPTAIFLPILLIIWFARGNREAGWLILPSLGPAVAAILNDIPYIGPAFHWDFTDIRIGSVPVAKADLANFSFLLAVGVVMALRFTRVSQEQARAAAELDAAREIQQRLVPIVLPELRGCRIETAYLPADEVGGDFYQVLEQPDGSILIVVGDVSGKGLRAAMTGALAIGALRTLAAGGLSPAALLTALNLQIVAAEQGGFITAVCARITAAGEVIIANAGHLHPYCNGEEIDLDSGLPLGISPHATYSETRTDVASGDMLTFLSDGVAEARSATGELFGFDRTREISRQSARADCACCPVLRSVGRHYCSHARFCFREALTVQTNLGRSKFRHNFLSSIGHLG